MQPLPPLTLYLHARMMGYLPELTATLGFQACWFCCFRIRRKFSEKFRGGVPTSVIPKAVVSSDNSASFDPTRFLEAISSEELIHDDERSSTNRPVDSTSHSTSLTSPSPKKRRRSSDSGVGRRSTSRSSTGADSSSSSASSQSRSPSDRDFKSRWRAKDSSVSGDGRKSGGCKESLSSESRETTTTSASDDLRKNPTPKGYCGRYRNEQSKDRRRYDIHTR